MTTLCDGCDLKLYFTPIFKLACMKDDFSPYWLFTYRIGMLELMNNNYDIVILTILCDGCDLKLYYEIVVYWIDITLYTYTHIYIYRHTHTFSVSILGSSTSLKVK